MYFKTLVTIHLIATVLWIGGLFFLSYVILLDSGQGNESSEHPPYLKGLVHRYQQLSVGASIILLITGFMMLPSRSFESPLRIGALWTMIIGWVVLTIMSGRMMPDQRDADESDHTGDEEKEALKPDRLYWTFLINSLIAVLILISGVVLAYTA